MTTDFTAADLQRAIDGEYGEEYTVVRYKIRDEYKNESWADADGGTDSHWYAEKDDEGFPVILSARTVTSKDDDFDEDYSNGEYASELFYEGGYVHPYGLFKCLDYGNLGDGHEAWSLIQHQESGRYFRREGYYSSWDSGTVLDGDLVEVVPAEVKVQRYRPIDSDEIYDYPAITIE